MKKTPHTLLEELAIIDAALLDGTHTGEQEAKRQQIVNLANAAPELLDALDYFFNIMHDYESSLQKGYIKHALQKARRAIAKAKGDCI